MEAGVKKSGKSIEREHLMEADDKTSGPSNEKEHSMEADDKTSYFLINKHSWFYVTLLLYLYSLLKKYILNYI